MKQFSTLLVLTVFFFTSSSNCCGQKKVDNKLIGDWICDDTRLIISFSDTTIGFFDWGDFENCFTESDTIYFDTRDYIKKDYSYLDSAVWQPRIKRTIKTGIDTLGSYFVSNDSLTINVTNPNYTWENEIQRYYKLKPKSEITFDSLFVKTSMCKGICQAMEIKLTSSGEFFFKGKAYTELLGSYKGNLSTDLIETVSSKINQLDFNSYDSSYIAGHTDGQTRSLILYHGNKREYIHIYGHEEEPLEVNVAFHYLTELYKWIDLKKSNSELRFEEIEKTYPPPLDISIWLKQIAKEKEELFEIIKSCIYSHSIQEYLEIDTTSRLPLYIHTYSAYDDISIDTVGMKLFQRPILFIDENTAEIYFLNDMPIDPGLEFNAYEIKDGKCELNLRFKNRDYIIISSRTNNKWKIESIVEGS